MKHSTIYIVIILTVFFALSTAIVSATEDYSTLSRKELIKLLKERDQKIINLKANEEAISSVNSKLPPIAPGDTLNIEVYQEDDLSGEFLVKESGVITYPLLGSVNVVGLTSAAAEDKIIKMLKNGYLKNPYVQVRTEEQHARRVKVFGEVKKPGIYDFPENENLSLMEAISMAQGFTQFASMKGVKVIRLKPSGKKKVIDPDMPAILSGKKDDLILEPGDLITVSEGGFL